MKNYLVTGSCGFIGYNLITKLLNNKTINIIGIDNLSRFGSNENYKILSKYKNFTFYKVDIENHSKLDKIFKKYKPDVICHLAAQVAVTLSYKNPIKDFNTNAMGSLNLLSLAHKYNKKCYCLYSSTNKVYGSVDFKKPVDEYTQEKPYTPYGVSKYIGDLYFKEFNSKEYGIRTITLKQSCIYGPNQYGIEDQGWLIWFLYKNLFGKTLNIYGDGKQVRDLLYVDDLVSLYIKLIKKKITGSYPIGGGLKNSISLNDAILLIEKITKKKFKKIRYLKKRSGDQSFFVSNNNWTKKNNLKWSPKTSPNQGLVKMINWIKENEKYLLKIYEKKI